MPTIFDTTKPLKQRRLIVKHELCNLSEANETSSTDIVTTEDTTEEEPVEQLSICTIRHKGNEKLFVSVRAFYQQ